MLKRSFLIAAFLFFAFSSQARAEEPAEYQIVSGKEGIFMLNTKTGSLWEFTTETMGKKDNILIKFFAPIKVLNSDEEVMDFLLEKATLIDKIENLNKSK